MPPTYYRHPKIFTGKDETTFATAFAVEDGRFTWVGAAAEIPPGAPVTGLQGSVTGLEGSVTGLQGSVTGLQGSVTDLEGSVVLPGFIDAHTHPTFVSQNVGAVACTIPRITSIPQMLEALRRHPNAGKSAEAWIEGWGYDESKLAEHRTPTRADLDRVSTAQPVYVMRSDCHSGICNTRALELAGITRETPDPPDGAFGRDADGVPNGILKEHGANQAVLRAKGAADFESDVAKLVRTSAYLASHGIVAVTDMFCTPGSYRQLDLYREAQRRGFTQHARLYYSFEALQQAPFPITAADRTGQVAVGGIKLFMDGSISNRTAWMRDPYPNTAGETGMAMSSRQELAAALAFARQHHLQIAIHAMGDRAIEEVMDFFADEAPWMGDIPSVRIEHASMWTPELLRRVRRMAFGVATNIDFFFCEYDSYAQNLSPEQFARTYPVRDLLATIEALALSSDSPATTWDEPDNVFLSIQAAVTRKAYNGASIVPSQAITVPQAVLLYTGRARTLGDTPDLGMIAPGFQASFITLNGDIFTMPPETIINTRVTGTWIRGEKNLSARSLNGTLRVSSLKRFSSGGW